MQEYGIGLYGLGVMGSSLAKNMDSARVRCSPLQQTRGRTGRL